MGCHGMVHLTRGLAYCPQTEVVEGETRYVLPFNLSLRTDAFNLNLKNKDVINLDSQLKQNKLNLVRLPSLKINKDLKSLKLNLKLCEE